MTARTRTRRALPFVMSAIAAVLAVVVAALPGAADTFIETSPVQVVGIDARDGGVAVDFLNLGEPVDRVTVEVDGAAYEGEAKPLRDHGIVPGVMAVLDSSAAATNATMRLALDDLIALAPTEDGIRQLGVVTTGAGARLVGRPAGSYDAAVANARDTRVDGNASIWDALVIAARAQGTTPNVRRHVVAVVASADVVSSHEYSQVVRILRDHDVVVHVIEVAGRQVNGGELRDLVRVLGGTYQVGSDAEFTEMYGRIGDAILGERRVTIPEVERADVEISTLRLDVAGTVVTAGFRGGVVARGAEAVQPTPVQIGAADGFFTSAVVRYLIIGISAAAATGFVYAVALLASRRRDNLDYALRYYDDSFDAVGGPTVDDGNNASAALLQRVVDVTENIAKDRGVLNRVESLLERADLPLRPAEALTFYLGGAAVAVLLAAFLTRNPMAMLVVALVAAIVPGFSVDFLAKRRKKQFEAMLPDMLTLLAGTLRAGYSIGQGIEAVSNEVDDPMGKELKRAVSEARLGRPLDEALEGIAERLDSDDFGWAVMAIRIQREVGGNLAELLMTVADTMVQRERLRRDVASLTAEGRMSAMILGLLPPGLAVVMWVMNPEYISKLFSGAGLFLLGASIVMMIIGFVWMKKTITIEV